MVVIPIVSVRDLRAALESMVNPSVEPALESLKLLYLVEDARNAAHSPYVPSNDTYWVYEVLSEIIRETLSARRRAHDLSTELDEIDRIKDAESVISTDGMTDDKELIHWSLLYFCFVRVDLNVTLATYGGIVGLTERTMRRYRDYAIERLTHEIIRREQVIRLRRKSQLLLASLPVTPAKYVGHNDLLVQTLNEIRNDPQLNFFIYGDRGSGKSTFVAQLLKLYVQDNNTTFKHLVWFDKLKSVDEIVSRLHPGLETEEAVKLWLVANPTVVVLDELAGDSIHLLDRLADILRHALLIVVERAMILPEKFDLRVRLPRMSREDIPEFLTRNVLVTHGVDQMSDDAIESVVVRSGGNPSKAITLAKQILYEDFDNNASSYSALGVDLPGVLQNVQSLRRIGEYVKANVHLKSHLLLVNHKQNSEAVCRLMLEKVFTSRAQGQFTQALDELDEVMSIAQSQSINHFIYDSGLLERARIYLDVYQLDNARDAAQAITHPEVKASGKYRIIYAELALRYQKIDESRICAESVLNTSHSRYHKGQAYNVLGHGYVAQSVTNDAEESFVCALSCFDAVSEPLSYARTLNNLGVVYMTQDRVNEAEDILEHAYIIQQHYRDDVGLLYTTKNLSLLR